MTYFLVGIFPRTGAGGIFSWGRGTFGRLGTGREDDEPFPVPVVFGDDSVNGGSEQPKFVGIAAGAYHSLALQGLISVVVRVVWFSSN